MKKLINLVFILLMIAFTLFSITKKSFAVSSASVVIEGNSDVEAKSTFTIDLKLSNLQSNKGFNSLIGTLIYDTDKLTLDKLTSKNGWNTPSYNEEDGTFLIERDTYMVTDATFITLTFTVKDDATGSAYITLKNVSVANENEEIKLNNDTKNLTINKANIDDPSPSPSPTSSPTPSPTPTPSPDDDNKPNTNPNEPDNTPNKPSGGNSNDNNSNTNNSSSNTKPGTTYDKGNLPQTGSGNIILISLGLLCLINSVIVLIKMKK